MRRGRASSSASVLGVAAKGGSSGIELDRVVVFWLYHGTVSNGLRSYWWSFSTTPPFTGLRLKPYGDAFLPQNAVFQKSATFAISNLKLVYFKFHNRIINLILTRNKTIIYMCDNNIVGQA